MSCLDDVALEKVLLGSLPQVPHLTECARCTDRLARMREENERFRRFVFPATAEAVAASVAPPRWRLGLMVALPLATAAAVAFVVQTRGPADDYVGVKGTPTVALDVFTLDDAGAARRLSEPATVDPGASLRFQVRPMAPCYLWLVSTDAQGQVSRLFPISGDEPARLTEATTLPGGATLDGQTGPERLIAVCTPAPLPYGVVESAARTTSAEAVRRLTRLEGIDSHATVLLEKEPR